MRDLRHMPETIAGLGAKPRCLVTGIVLKESPFIAALHTTSEERANYLVLPLFAVVLRDYFSACESGPSEEGKVRFRQVHGSPGLQSGTRQFEK